MGKFDDALEMIGQAIFEYWDGVDNNEGYSETSRFLNLAMDSYVIITWPEVQELMEEDWFAEEAILESEGTFGSSAYFIPIKRIMDL